MKKTVLFLLLFSLLLPCAAGCAGEPVRYRSAEGWEGGYGEREIPLDTENIGQYYVAGYRNDNPAVGVLDIPKAKALWLGAEEGCLLLIAVDCVALADGDTDIIRNRLSHLQGETGCEILVCATHTHAAPDTLGLWGKIAVNGKNGAYMEALYTACAEAGEEAFAKRRRGTLLYGSTDQGIGDLQEDSRDPQVFDRYLHQLRFVPDEGGKGIRLINYAAHAESLRGDNRRISADCPAYLAREIRERTGDDTVFVQGAIGGLIMTRRLKNGNGVELPVEQNCRETGKLLARAALSITEERELPPLLRFASERIGLPLDNDVFVAMASLGILNTKALPGGKGRHGLSMEVLLRRLVIGDLEVVTLPGEIFPELVYGGGETVSGIVGREFLLFGLCDGEIGYIIPEKDFLLNEEHPFLDTVTDSTGENHYEETNSLGKQTGALILAGIGRLYG